MDTINENKNSASEEETLKKWEHEHRRGRLIGGFFVVLIGALFLARELGVIIPDWIFTWQMLLITIGIFSGIKHSFRTFGWIILVLIGAGFLLKDYAPFLHISNFIWPVAIILVGLFIIIKPKRKGCHDAAHWQRRRFSHHHGMQRDYVTSYAKEDFLEFNAIFGGIKKNIISKTFRGGEVNAVFGGAELNLMQADFTGTIELEINCVFGGARLIVPSNWTIKSEVSAVMGSVEDKRPLAKEDSADPEKVLVLRGNAVFGGIEIQSFAI